MNTLEDWKKWVAHWIISGNKSIVCVQHSNMFNFFSDKHEPLEYTIHLDKENLPFICFTDSQGDMGYRTCTLSKEPVQGVKVNTVSIADELEAIKTSRPERYASREVNGMDVIDLADHWNLGNCEFNILKYLLRDKGEDISDLEKIIDYADRRIKQLKK